MLKKDEVVCSDGKIYKEYKPVIKKINVTDYKDIVIIDGKLFTEVKKKGGGVVEHSALQVMFWELKKELSKKDKYIEKLEKKLKMKGGE